MQNYHAYPQALNDYRTVTDKESFSDPITWFSKFDKALGEFISCGGSSKLATCMATSAIGTVVFRATQLCNTQETAAAVAATEDEVPYFSTRRTASEYLDPDLYYALDCTLARIMLMNSCQSNFAEFTSVFLPHYACTALERILWLAQTWRRPAANGPVCGCRLK